MSEQPVSVSGHLDWLKQNLPVFKYGQIGLIFTIRDGTVILCQRVFRETFKSQAGQISLDGDERNW